MNSQPFYVCRHSFDRLQQSGPHTSLSQHTMGSIEKPIRVSEERECVQEMVKMDPSFIPQKYLRSEEERAKDNIVDISLNSSSQIPILDLALLFNGDKGELEKLDKACQEWGFFQKEKLLFFRRDAVETYSAEVRKVAGKLFGCLSLIMGMEKEEGLLELQKELQISMRVTYYPTCSSPNKVLGLSPHSDASSITIFMQNNDTVGLQIRHDGGWVPVKPVPNSLIINVGDVLEMWSNGKYKSIEHRAVTSETNTRISFGAFVMPNIDVEIEPLQEMLSMQQKPAKYKKVKFGDYLTYALRQKMDGKANIEDVTNQLRHHCCWNSSNHCRNSDDLNGVPKTFARAPIALAGIPATLSELRFGAMQSTTVLSMHIAMTNETNTSISFGAFIYPILMWKHEPLEEILNMQQKPAKTSRKRCNDSNEDSDPQINMSELPLKKLMKTFEILECEEERGEKKKNKKMKKNKRKKYRHHVDTDIDKIEA
ncbi:hypothetical protein LguiB_027770 [Lonicera macranthoides]